MTPRTLGRTGSVRRTTRAEKGNGQFGMIRTTHALSGSVILRMRRGSPANGSIGTGVSPLTAQRAAGAAQALQVARENPGLDRDEAARQTLEILQLTPRAKRQVERATSRALTAVAQRESVLPAPEKADSVPEPPEPTGGIRIFDPEDYA